MSPDAISHLHNMMQAGFATLADLQRETNQRLDLTVERLDHTVERLDRHETLLERLVDKVVVLDERSQRHEAAMVALSGQLQSLDQRFDNFLTGTHGQSHHDVELRLKRLEQHAGFSRDSSPQ